MNEQNIKLTRLTMVVIGIIAVIAIVAFVFTNNQTNELVVEKKTDTTLQQEISADADKPAPTEQITMDTVTETQSLTNATNTEVIVEGYSFSRNRGRGNSGNNNTNDTVKPVITLIGNSTVNIQKNETYTDAGATATDNKDGNITSSIIISGTVNTSVVSTYYLYFNVKDAAGNAASQVRRTVKVTEPTTPIPTPTPTTTPTSTPTTPPPSGQSRVSWGAYTGGTPASLTTFENLVGKPVDMNAVFVGWGSNGNFPSTYKSSLADKGKTLVIFWEPYGTTLDAINSGTWDSYMNQFAAAAKTYGGPVILSPFHEMNGNWDPWGGTVGNNTPTKLIAAWQRMYGFFDEATNVKFVWAVNNVSVPNTSANAITAYYPGDNYVDYVGIDGFNFNDPWQTFSQVFNSALATVKTYNKPIYLTSMASAAGTQKATWITDTFTVQIPKHPEIVGWIWFNENKEQDWRINSDSASLEAFKAILPSTPTPPLPNTNTNTNNSNQTNNSTPPDTNTTTSTSTTTPPPTQTTTGVLWGAYAGWLVSDYTAFESLVGKTMNLHTTYIAWGGFPSELKSSVADKGKTLVIFWEPYDTTLDAINSGTHDAYFTQFAQAAKNYSGPVILAPFHQMNGNWFPWGGTVGNNSPTKIITAWQKIHGYFNEAPNVKFAWDVNQESVPSTSANSITAYYPGDNYVDYVAIDGWNWGNPWQTFTQIYSQALTTLKSYNKPIYLLSITSAPSTLKADWITDALKTQILKYPEIAGWIWYNRNESKDWRINSDSASLDAFKILLP